MIEQGNWKSEPPTRKDGTRRIDDSFTTIKQGAPRALVDEPSYFYSPIKTIVASTALTPSVATHDLLDAYCVLTIRLKCFVVSLSTANTRTTFPALEPLKTNNASILQALVRDLQCAPVKSITNETRNASSNAVFPESQSSALYPSDTYKQSQVHYILDSETLCHYALRVLSIIFKFKVIHQLFQGK